MLPIGNEVMNFVHACEAVHALLAQGVLAPEDRTLIENRSIERLSKLGANDGIGRSGSSGVRFYCSQEWWATRRRRAFSLNIQRYQV